MELIGKLKAIQPIIERGEFKSRKIWVTTEDNPQYPQTIEIEVSQAKVDMFNGISIGAPVKMYLNLRGREWTGTDGVTKVFNSIVCWKVEALPGGQVAAPATASQQGFTQEPEPIDDLPF